MKSKTARKRENVRQKCLLLNFKILALIAILLHVFQSSRSNNFRSPCMYKKYMYFFLTHSVSHTFNIHRNEAHRFDKTSVCVHILYENLIRRMCL